uniref:Uncharacterized protein n=1 Tax=Meloidogyne enterolobii TaxID=390850 RepID=A0A6V7UJ62_MELEN|nr:unnamed protein product [Meloidogyne enterolobii]
MSLHPTTSSAKETSCSISGIFFIDIDDNNGIDSQHTGKRPLLAITRNQSYELRRSFDNVDKDLLPLKAVTTEYLDQKQRYLLWVKSAKSMCSTIATTFSPKMKWKDKGGMNYSINNHEDSFSTGRYSSLPNFYNNQIINNKRRNTVENYLNKYNNNYNYHQKIKVS